MIKRKIYVVGSSIGYANWMQGELVNKIEDADLVCFTGGEDVSPNLYNEPKHYTTCNNPKRDGYEIGMFQRAIELKKHMIGICRGAQFLCVMNGGKLVQDQENKYSMHDIYTYDGQKLEISSTHHQAAYPWNLKNGKDFKILGWTTNLSKFHLDGNGKELLKAKDIFEVENVFYPKTKAYCVQGHPEWMELNHPTVKYLQNQLNLFMQDKL